MPRIEVPSVNITNLTVLDNGLVINSTIRFKNFIPLEINIPAFTFQLHVNDTPFSRIRFQNFSLPLPSSTPSVATPSIQITAPDGVTRDEFFKRASLLIATSTKISVVGPVEWTSLNSEEENAPWLKAITEGFKMDIQIRQMLELLVRIIPR
ncbi:hypothetical protein BKA69DRAFT_59913 [Paraphysoderma sedebokerense]|nr:hypothetical protein BKA69DRAFT_59913 [Paraphysoderma sedebokerense]